MEVELAASEGRIRSAAERGLVVPDHTLTLGEKTYSLFPSRANRGNSTSTGVCRRSTTATIRELFLDFVARMEMSGSYKPVLLLAMLDKVDDHGREARLKTLSRRSKLVLPCSTPTKVYLSNEATMRLQQRGEIVSPRTEVRAVMLRYSHSASSRQSTCSWTIDRSVAYLRFQTSSLATAHGGRPTQQVRSRCEQSQ